MEYLIGLAYILIQIMRLYFKILILIVFIVFVE